MLKEELSKGTPLLKFISAIAEYPFPYGKNY